MPHLHFRLSNINTMATMWNKQKGTTLYGIDCKAYYVCRRQEKHRSETLLHQSNLTKHSPRSWRRWAKGTAKAAGAARGRLKMNAVIRNNKGNWNLKIKSILGQDKSERGLQHVQHAGFSWGIEQCPKGAHDSSTDLKTTFSISNEHK